MKTLQHLYKFHGNLSSAQALKSCLKALKELNCDALTIYPFKYCDDDEIWDYWSEMYSAGRLAYRFSDVEKPSVEFAYTFSYETRDMYAVVDNRGIILAEFTLDAITGAARQLHVSVRPGISSAAAVGLADTVSNMVLGCWKKPESVNEPYLDTLFGITPVKNRAACAFVLKAGFEKLAIMPNGAKFLNRVDDAMITAKTRSNYGV